MEEEIRAIIGAEFAYNVVEQFGLIRAMTLPQEYWEFFVEFTEEVREQW